MMKDKKRAKGKKFFATCSSHFSLITFHLLLPFIHPSSFLIHHLPFGVARSQKMICVPFTGFVAS